jgi:hypothetical protein
VLQGVPTKVQLLAGALQHVLDMTQTMPPSTTRSACSIQSGEPLIQNEYRNQLSTHHFTLQFTRVNVQLPHPTFYYKGANLQFKVNQLAIIKKLP